MILTNVEAVRKASQKSLPTSENQVDPSLSPTRQVTAEDINE